MTDETCQTCKNLFPCADGSWCCSINSDREFYGEPSETTCKCYERYEYEVQKDEPPENKPPELTQEQIIAASERKDQRLREINNERCNLEDDIAEHRREANSLRKSLQDVMSNLNRIITSDIAGFIRWEKEQELPLLQAAERETNAWRELPVDKLDVTAKDKEHLAEHFFDCGQVADWIGKDFPDKKPGLNGEKTKDRLRDAINKISGVDEKQPVNEPETAPEEKKESVADFRSRIFDMLNNERFNFAQDTLEGIFELVGIHETYTGEQMVAVRNIEESIKQKY
ncbi:hypothetical protein FACS189419_04880 [Planctomycetales bacterium]|nr:hypothetical protein FACS189419_04880 [Planctomycetales bacterium]